VYGNVTKKGNHLEINNFLCIFAVRMKRIAYIVIVVVVLLCRYVRNFMRLNIYTNIIKMPAFDLKKMQKEDAEMEGLQQL
jgi:hypothetical protein